MRVVCFLHSATLCCRALSIPESYDLSRSSSNASSFTSVVEENDHELEATEDYDTGLVTPEFSTTYQHAQLPIHFS